MARMSAAPPLKPRPRRPDREVMTSYSRRLAAALAGAATLLALAPTASLSARTPTGVPGDPYAALLAPPTACKGQSRTQATAKVHARAMLCLVNYARRRQGASPLRSSAPLDRSSRLKAREIIRCNDFSHTPCGQSFYATFTRAGYMKGRAFVGENIYWGSVLYGSPRIAFNAWLHSEGHRRNLLGKSWRDLGIARIQSNSLGGAGGVVWVTAFGWRG